MLTTHRILLVALILLGAHLADCKAATLDAPAATCGLSTHVLAYVLATTALSAARVFFMLIAKAEADEPRSIQIGRRISLLTRTVLIVWAIALLSLSSSAQAATFGAHLYTQHLGAHADDLNSATPGLYVRTEAGLTAGVFRNSYGRTSTYAGWTWQTDDQRFALTAGAVTGYPAKPVLPLLVPSVRIGLAEGYAAPGQEPQGWALRVAFMPRQPHCGTAAGLHFTVERSF